MLELKKCWVIGRAAYSSHVNFEFRCAGHLAEIVDRVCDAIGAPIVARVGSAIIPEFCHRNGRQLAVAEAIPSDRNPQNPLPLGSTLECCSAHNSLQALFPTASLSRSPKAAFADVNDLLVEYRLPHGRSLASEPWTEPTLFHCS